MVPRDVTVKLNEAVAHTVIAVRLSHLRFQGAILLPSYTLCELMLIVRNHDVPDRIA